MKRFMSLLILSCKKATALLGKREVLPLSFKEKIQLKLHIYVCKACNAYENQSVTMDHTLTKLSNRQSSEKRTLKPALKQKIINEIKNF